MPKLYLSSTLLSDDHLVAGFSTRFGGDDQAGLALGVGLASPLYMVTQVHGSAVVEIGGEEPVEEVRCIEADALITRAPGVTLAVRTADCVPLLLASGGGEGAIAVAAVHAGWRGVVAGVIKAAVEALISEGSAASELRAAIGPAIDPCCFEVHEDVAEELATAVGHREIILERGRGARPHVDLRGAALWSLVDAGLCRERVEVVGPCTKCSPELLHSYRREGGGVGRQLSFIQISNL